MDIDEIDIVTIQEVFSPERQWTYVIADTAADALAIVRDRDIDLIICRVDPLSVESVEMIYDLTEIRDGIAPPKVITCSVFNPVGFENLMTQVRSDVHFKMPLAASDLAMWAQQFDMASVS